MERRPDGGRRPKFSISGLQLIRKEPQLSAKRKIVGSLAQSTAWLFANHPSLDRVRQLLFIKQLGYHHTVFAVSLCHCVAVKLTNQRLPKRSTLLLDQSATQRRSETAMTVTSVSSELKDLNLGKLWISLARNAQKFRVAACVSSQFSSNVYKVFLYTHINDKKS